MPSSPLPDQANSQNRAEMDRRAAARRVRAQRQANADLERENERRQREQEEERREIKVRNDRRAEEAAKAAALRVGQRKAIARLDSLSSSLCGSLTPTSITSNPLSKAQAEASKLASDYLRQQQEEKDAQEKEERRLAKQEARRQQDEERARKNLRRDSILLRRLEEEAALRPAREEEEIGEGRVEFAYHGGGDEG